MTAIKAFIVTVSDTRTLDTDASGDRLAELLLEWGAEIIGKIIISDDIDGIVDTLEVLLDREDVNLILTTGGTGFGPRDNTPEATRAVVDREAPGLAEAMRRETAAKTPLSMLSRAVAGIKGSTLIINLPGSPKAVEECFEVIKPVIGHALELLAGHTQHST